jgi:hypothetical protein
MIVCIQQSALAGLQITANETIKAAMPVTNLVVSKFQTNNVRIDTGSTMSTIVLPDGSAVLQLFHESKTYRWIAIDPSTKTNSSSPLVIPAGEATLNNSPAKLFCWTNGNTYGRIWLTSLGKFVDSGTNLVTVSNANSIVTANLSVGSLLGTNSVVARTEHATVHNLPVLHVRA